MNAKITAREAIEACRDMAHTHRTNQTVRLPSPDEWDAIATLIDNHVQMITALQSREAVLVGALDMLLQSFYAECREGNCGDDCFTDCPTYPRIQFAKQVLSSIAPNPYMELLEAADKTASRWNWEFDSRNSHDPENDTLTSFLDEMHEKISALTAAIKAAKGV